MNHNDALDLFGKCDCGCHRKHATPCWCRNTNEPDPYQISHNDRVQHFGRCGRHDRNCRTTRTAPDIAYKLEAKAEKEQEKRIMQGTPTSADLKHIIRYYKKM